MGLNWRRGVIIVFLLLAWVLFIITGELFFFMDEKTTTFVRDDSLSVDMPIDSDVFRVPPGYNAPQQVITNKRVFFHGRLKI